MKDKHHGGPAPVPPGNRPHAGPASQNADAGETNDPDPGGGDRFQDQDVQRRLGNFESAGEHARQQPGRANDGDQHSR